ncbi:MAG: hypothetical protein EBV19_08165, partial [Flavobacteriia bacterium]|nr:hypothetical protein [Flavobacteriia bacterium]
MYQYSSAHPEIVEGWFNYPMQSVVQTTTGIMHKPHPDAESVFVPLTNQSGNNVAQLNVTTTPIVNTSMLSNSQQNELVQVGQSLAAEIAPREQAFAKLVHENMKGAKHMEGAENVKEKYQDTITGPKGFFTVPGYTQNNPPPRFSNTGYGGMITYNLPEVKNLASDPHDVLSRKPPGDRARDMANMVENFEHTGVKHNKSNELTDFGFKYPDASPSKEYERLQNQIENPSAYNQGAGRVVEMETPVPQSEFAASSGMSKQADDVRNRLPMQSMDSGAYGEDQTVYVNMDQMVFATLKSPLYGLGDFIRGDLPIKPQPPVTDPCSYINFRPSARPANTLNLGAMNVMGGEGNRTAVDTQELVA